MQGGVACNIQIDAGIDELLHSWQLRFMMVGFSGGFLSKSTGDSDDDGGAEPSPLAPDEQFKNPDSPSLKHSLDGVDSIAYLTEDV